MRLSRGCLGLALLAILVLFGCNQSRVPLLILTAASTQEAVQEIASQFTRQTGVGVRINADDSSKLAAQIVHGAPADLFLSANEQWAQHLQERGLVQEIQPLLGNSLVLIVPHGNPLELTGPRDLLEPSVKRVALAGPTVPAGIYGRQALRHLHLLDDLEKEKKIITGESVRVTLAYVERGEVEAGIVYGTDARISDKIEVVATFPPSSHAAIVYPLALLRSAAANADARKFYHYLQGRESADVFRKHGFTWLDKN